MTKEEFDASPKCICLLCSMEILADGKFMKHNHLHRHILDFHPTLIQATVDFDENKQYLFTDPFHSYSDILV